MVLVSFKNIFIFGQVMAKMERMPIFGHIFFGHNSAISGPIGPLLAGKWAWPPRAPLMVWGLQTQPKRCPTGWTFWANRYLEIMFSKFSGVNHRTPP